MGFIVPYVPGMLEPAVSGAMLVEGATLVEIDPADNEHYWRVLCEEWAIPRYTIVVEHDVLPARGVLARMRNCRHPWCTSPYPINAVTLTEGLGCVRFHPCLKRRHPDFMRNVGQMGGDGAPPRDWHRLDTRIAALLRHLGYTPHTHAESRHLHDYARRP